MSSSEGIGESGLELGDVVLRYGETVPVSARHLLEISRAKEKAAKKGPGADRILLRLLRCGEQVELWTPALTINAKFVEVSAAAIAAETLARRRVRPQSFRETLFRYVGKHITTNFGSAALLHVGEEYLTLFGTEQEVHVPIRWIYSVTEPIGILPLHVSFFDMMVQVQQQPQQVNSSWAVGFGFSFDF